MASTESREGMPLPEGWIKCISKSLQGKEYYFNTLTGESLWEHPGGEQLQKQNIANNAGFQAVKIKEEPKDKSPKAATLNPLAPLARKRLLQDSNEEDSNRKTTTLRTIRKVTEIKDIRKVETKTDAGLQVQKGGRNIQKSSPEAGKNNGPSRLKRTVMTSREGTTKTDTLASNDLKSDKTSKSADLSKKTTGIGDKAKETQNKGVQKKNNTSKSLPPLKPIRKNLKRQKIIKMVEATTKRVDSSYRIPKKVNADAGDGRTPDKAVKTALKSSTIANTQFNTSTQTNTNTQVNTNKQMSARNSVENRPIWQEFSVKNNSLGTTNSNFHKSPDSLSNHSLSNQTSNNWSDTAMAYSDSCDGSDVILGTDEMPPLVDMSYEDMEIDDMEFMERKIFHEIQGVRLERIPVPKPTDDNATQEQMDVPIPHGTLYIVVDTNILLSHLKFVSELKDFPIPGVGRPILVIPWMVVQELDRLKEAPDSRVHEFSEESEQNGTGVNILARRAVSFLNNCFTENHPRIRGQTLVEASSSFPGLVEETNDDSILSCCLFYQNKAESSKTVLLSNDRNLCNKAIVNNVKAFPKKSLISGLRDLFQAGSLIVHKDHFKEYFEEAGNQEALAERRKKADDLKCELQCILREAFSAVIEKEMKEAYDELWLEIVKIKPPWTMVDTLELLEKHWMAVFGHQVRRNLKDQVVSLKKKFACGDASGKILQHASELIDLGFVLCDAFSKRSDYDGVMPKCLAAIIVLQRKCKEFVSEISPAIIKTNGTVSDSQNGTGINTYEITNCVTSVLHKDDTAMNLNSPITPTTPVTPSMPVAPTTPNGESDVAKHFAVMSAFDEIWKAVTMLSSLIFDSLEYPNPYSNTEDQSEWKPSKEEARRFLENLVPCLGRLVKAIQGVLACPLQSSLDNVDIFNQLGESIAHFMKKIMCQDCQITLDQLRSFCLDGQSRTALIQGLSQLDRALAMLQHCLSFNVR